MPYPQVKSLNDTPNKLIVFLHGVGSDGDDLIPLTPYMQQDLPDYYFISPHGVEPYDMAPFGRQWFSLQNRDPGILTGLMAKSARKLEAIIKEKQVKLNLTNADTILVGFSQGTMLALYLNLTAHEPFGTIIGFSGVLIPPQHPINMTTPICLIHGTEDDVIDVEAMYKAAQYFKDQNIKHKICAIPNLRHSIDDKGIQLAINFIKETAQ